VRTKDEIDRADARPDAVPVNPVGIPQTLKERRQWVAWKYQRRQDRSGKGKWTKVPVDPRTGRNASTKEPATWGTFNEALSALQNRPEMCAGIGFVFSPEDPFCGVDLDDCRDLETGAIAEWAAGLVRQLASYAEVSPSGTGVKVFVQGTRPKGRNRPGYVEIYDQGRYFAVTGHRLPEGPATVEARQAELEQLQRSLRQDSGRTSL
jgi:putative DNA primase/helicase